MEKSATPAAARAALNKARMLWGALGGGSATSLGMDYRMNPDEDAIFGYTTLKDLVTGNMDKDRSFNLAVNAALGAAGGAAIGAKPLEGLVPGLGAMAMAPGKDLIINSLQTPGKANEAFDAMSESSKVNKWLLGALGAGALGLGALGVGKYLTKKDPKSEMGRIKLRLPGKKGDPETAAEVELPIDMPEMSPAMIEGLNRGVRRQANKNIKANSFKRDPMSGKLIPTEEWEDKYGKGSPYAMAMMQEKAASREWAEGAGSVLTALGAGAAGAVGGNMLAAHLSREGVLQNGKRPLTLLGAALGAALPHIAGKALASIPDERTEADQAKHDQGAAGAEYLIPGFAAYQQERRLSVDPTKKNSDALAGELAMNSYAATGAMPGGYAMYEDTLDKYAYAGQSGPYVQQPVAAPTQPVQPAPVAPAPAVPQAPPVTPAGQPAMPVSKPVADANRVPVYGTLPVARDSRYKGPDDGHAIAKNIKLKLKGMALARSTA